VRARAVMGRCCRLEGMRTARPTFLIRV
jgi:hypothetical protein